MSEYKNIIGKGVRFLSSNLDNDQAEGQIWYNSTDDAFKNLLINEAWASGSPMIFNRAYIAGFGTQTAAIGCGGYNSPPATFETATEEYNGSGFSTGGALNTGRWGIRGAGSQTAGLAFFGIVPGSPNRSVATEEYNGTSWTNGGNLSEGRYQGAAAGTQTAGLAFGGGPATASPPVTTATEEYDGSSWTNGGALNTAIRDNASASAAPQTAAISFGGSNASTFSAQSEEYDGSSWTVVNSMSLARSVLGGSGIQTSALGYGGAGTPSNSINKTEAYDGTNWSTSPADLATGRRYLAGAGSNGSSAVAFQGKSGSTNTVLTEEYNKSVNVITGAAWASGGNMPEATSNVADGGTVTAAVKGGGQKNNPDSQPTASAEYNGTSWTAGNTLPANYSSVTGGTGTQTALITGGANNPTPGFTFEYDGTNWTAGGTLGTSRYQGKTLGTQTAAVTCGGRVSPPTLNNVEEYNGSSWTSATAMPIATRNGGGFGIQTAATVVSGFQGPSSPPVSPTSSVSRAALGFDYDGTNWTAGASSVIAGATGGAAGVQTVAIFLAGENPGLSPSSILTSQRYDGTSYVTDAAVGRSRCTAFGITSSRTAAVGDAAAIFGGTDPAASPNDTAATEEYNVATSALNIKTITTS
jgi:hypothetical protein